MMKSPLQTFALVLASASAASAQMANCVETMFATNNSIGPGGTVFFDVTITQGATFKSLLTNTSTVGAIGMTVYTTPLTYVGQELNMAAWTQVAEDDGSANGTGVNTMSEIVFSAPFGLSAGTWGFALVGRNNTTGFVMGHSYTNGTGTNQDFTSMDGVISIALGGANSQGFAGNVLSPRVWNGRLCYEMDLGSNFCSPATPNSTGNPASLGASGSTEVAQNDLVLEVSNLPADVFGYFLVGSTQGLVMNPGGSFGDLCLIGSLGRFVAPGQIKNSGVIGTFELALDNAAQPNGGGFAQIMVGETWNYQAWYRDVVGGVAGSNFTNGLEILFN